METAVHLVALMLGTGTVEVLELTKLGRNIAESPPSVTLAKVEVSSKNAKYKNKGGLEPEMQKLRVRKRTE